MADGPHNNVAMRIAVKYCGGCNPSIDRANLVGKLAILLAETHPEWKLVTLNEDDFDVILLINGCPVGCVQKQFLNEARPVFLIAGESLQRERISEKDLPAELITKIMQLGESPGRKENNENRTGIY